MSIVSNHCPSVIDEMNRILPEPSPSDWLDYQRYLDSLPDLPDEPEPDEAT
jgi:hypothetical protein